MGEVDFRIAPPRMIHVIIETPNIPEMERGA